MSSMSGPDERDFTFLRLFPDFAASCAAAAGWSVFKLRSGADDLAPDCAAVAPSTTSCHGEPRQHDSYVRLSDCPDE